MVNIEDIPVLVLNKIKEYALLRYGVKTVTELKDAIITEQFNKIINNYLDDIKLRLLRERADEAKVYEPTDAELIEKLQTRINAFK